MKTSRSLLLILLILSCSMLAYGQRSWSVSISYSPRVEHRDSYTRNLFYYPLSPILISDFRPTDHFSVSLGISFHYQKDRSESLYFVGTPTSPSYCILKTYLYEIPLQFNLHIFNKSKKLDPFIKTSIRYTFSHESGEMYYPGIQRNFYFNDNYVLWDFGAGLDINISQTISILSQISYGIGLKHYFDDFKYFEPLAGLRYTF